jgi:hypothetical protein
MKTAILALLAFGSIGNAQTKSDIQLPPNIRMYEPKNITPDKAQRVALSVQNLSNVPVSWDEVLHAFVIKNGRAQEMDLAEALLKRLDVPDPRVELTVYLIRASNPSAAEPPGNPVPAELKSTIEEMKGTFHYDRYSLWDALVLQPKGNGGEIQGILPSEAGNYVYNVDYGVYGGSALSDGKTVNLAHFRFGIKMPGLRPRAAVPNGQEGIESHIQTDVTVREGQKLVLGKIRLLPAGSGDLFLVLTTKIY